MSSSLAQRSGWASIPILAAVMVTTAAHAADEFTVNNRTEIVSNSVTGPGAASSFLDTGTHLFHESEIYRTSALANGWNTSLSTALRFTDSKQFDAFEDGRVSVQKLEFILKDNSKSITLGDYFANLSQYAMNKAIKGIGYQQNFASDQNYLRASYGTFDGQWGYLLRSDRTDEPMDRHGGGVRYQGQAGSLTYGANLALVRDRSDDTKRRAGESAWQQSLPSFDWEYRLDALTLAGEHAYSNTNEKTGAGASVDSSGAANKLTARAMIGAANVDATWERVDTDFKTLAGGATPDRERRYVKVDARLAKLWKVFGSIDYYHNSLNNQLAFRTSNTSYELGVTKRRAFDRKTLTVSASLRQRATDSHGGGADQTSDRIKLKANDTFGVFDVRGDIETIIDSQAARSRESMYNLGVSSRYEWDKWTLTPNLEFGKQERDNPAGGIDLSGTARISFTADRGDGTQMGLNFDNNLSNTPTLGTDSHVSRWVAFWETRPAAVRKGTLRFEIATNDYQFGNITTNYSEQIARVILSWPLDLIAK